MTSQPSQMVLVALLAAGCVTGTDVEIAEIVGIWDVPQAVYVSEADANLTFDVVAAGATAMMEIEAAGDFTLTIDDGETPVQVITGQLAIDGNDLDVTIGNRVFSGEVFLEDDRAVLRILGGVNYDFDDDGKTEPARLSLILDRAG